MAVKKKRGKLNTDKCILISILKNELVIKVIGFKWESAPEQKEEHIWISDACFLLITLSYYTHLVWIW